MWPECVSRSSSDNTQSWSWCSATRDQCVQCGGQKGTDDEIKDRPHPWRRWLACCCRFDVTASFAASCCYITLRQRCRHTKLNLPSMNVIVFDSNVTITIKSWTMTVLPGSTILNISRIYSLSVGICFLLLSLCKCYCDYGRYSAMILVYYFYLCSFVYLKTLWSIFVVFVCLPRVEYEFAALCLAGG